MHGVHPQHAEAGIAAHLDHLLGPAVLRRRPAPHPPARRRPRRSPRPCLIPVRRAWTVWTVWTVFVRRESPARGATLPNPTPPSTVPSPLRPQPLPRRNRPNCPNGPGQEVLRLSDCEAPTGLSIREGCIHRVPVGSLSERWLASLRWWRWDR